MHHLQQKILQLAQEIDVSNLGLKKLGKQIGVESPQQVKHHIVQLEKNGFIELDKGKNRIIKILNKQMFNKGKKLFKIPLLGMANCGDATAYADQHISDYLPVSESILGRSNAKGLFAVEAVGDSLNAAEDLKDGPIESGDYVIIDSTKNVPSSGDYVLSIIDGLANLKRFYKDDQNKIIKLVSESKQKMPPIVLHPSDLNTTGYTINGKIIKVIKN